MEAEMLQAKRWRPIAPVMGVRVLMELGDVDEDVAPAE